MGSKFNDDPRYALSKSEKITLLTAISILLLIFVLSALFDLGSKERRYSVKNYTYVDYEEPLEDVVIAKAHFDKGYNVFSTYMEGRYRRFVVLGGRSTSINEDGSPTYILGRFLNKGDTVFKEMFSRDIEVRRNGKAYSFRIRN